MPLPDPPPPAPGPGRPAGSLNDSQQRAILMGCLDLHRRMADMGALLVQSQEPSPFSLYVNDLSPTEAKVIRDYFGRLRATMWTRLEEAGIPLDVRRTGVRWAVQCGLISLHIAVAEMGPEKLRGYGPLPEAGRAQAVKVQQELTRLIDRVSSYLRQGLGHDLGQRLARLGAATAGAATLTALDRIVTRRGLVEFRPLLDQVVRRLEVPQFEVAVFGRVSSGKSSLLNHIAGMDVLPVGVMPVTAVPTRLVRGDRPAALVSFAEAGPRTVGVGELREYASEEGNPGNHKHVTGIRVQVPSPRLREGVVLVDTPGVGSLALSGGAETLAYLPQCDLGVVLIDAASTLTPDDLALLRQLYEAAVPAQVVLSKADLLTPADRQRTADYIRGLLRRELGLDLAVHPVSTVGADESLLTRWFTQEVEPLLARHRALAEESLRRKVAHLRESVLAALETLRARPGAGLDGRAPAEAAAVRRLLEEGDEAVRRARDRCRDWTADVSALVEVVLNDAARAVVEGGDQPGGAAQGPVAGVLRRVLAERAQMALGLVAWVQETLARTLESLRQASLPGRPEATPVRDVPLRGLPAPEHPPAARLRAGRPWWAALLPRLARWVTLRQLRGRLVPVLREQVGHYDRQLQRWVGAYLGQLAGLYEAQAEVVRQQVLWPANEGGAEPAADVRELEADLRELRQAEAAGGEAVAGGLT
jgi:GTP-binding protein EngB required for normal cell division